MTLTQILQKIRSAFYTKAETDNLLLGKSNTTHNHNSTYLGINAKASSASSADSVAWGGYLVNLRKYHSSLMIVVI